MALHCRDGVRRHGESVYVCALCVHTRHLILHLPQSPSIFEGPPHSVEERQREGDYPRQLQGHNKHMHTCVKR